MRIPTFKKPTFKKPRSKLAHEKSVKDPLNKLRPTGSIEADAKAEITEVQAAFRARAEKEKARFNDATDAGFYIVLVFEDGAQADIFMEEIDMAENDDIFIDGRIIAEKMGVKLKRLPIEVSKPNINKTFAKMARDIVKGE